MGGNKIRRENLVDQTGIEPVTSSMPLMRAPSCATGPHKNRQYTVSP